MLQAHRVDRTRDAITAQHDRLDPACGGPLQEVVSPPAGAVRVRVTVECIGACMSRWEYELPATVALHAGMVEPADVAPDAAAAYLAGSPAPIPERSRNGP